MSITYGGDYITDTDGGKLRPSSAVMRNRIINGAMVIDQRNAGASVNTDNSFPVDRFKISISGSATATAQQSSTAPQGFSKSVVYTIGTGAAQGTSSVYRIFQPIEGYNTADLGWGTANAKTVTLSFWVRSSVTGTFSGSLVESNGGTASYVFEYSIPTANTWTQISVTVAGPTIGTWQTTNSASIALVFDLGSGTNYQQSAGSWVASGNKFRSSGSVVLSATSGATFYITGVQLEVGSSATGFEYRQYGQELALCKRYFQKITNYMLQSANGTVDYILWLNINFPVEMRAAPSTSLGAPLSVEIPYDTIKTQSSAAVSITNASGVGAEISFSNFSSLTYNRIYRTYPGQQPLSLSAEL